MEEVQALAKGKVQIKHQQNVWKRIERPKSKEYRRAPYIRRRLVATTTQNPQKRLLEKQVQ